MGVPAHDERDFYLQKYDLKIVQVLKKSDSNNTKTFDPLLWKEWYKRRELYLHQFRSVRRNEGT